MAKSGNIQVTGGSNQALADDILPSSQLVSTIGGIIPDLLALKDSPICGVIAFGDKRECKLFDGASVGSSGVLTQAELVDSLSLVADASEVYIAEANTKTTKTYTVSGITPGVGYTGAPVFEEIADEVLAGSIPSLSLGAFISKVEDADALKRDEDTFVTSGNLLAVAFHQRSANVTVFEISEAEWDAASWEDSAEGSVTPFAVYSFDVPASGGGASSSEFFESGGSL